MGGLQFSTKIKASIKSYGLFILRFGFYIGIGKTMLPAIMHQVFHQLSSNTLSLPVGMYPHIINISGRFFIVTGIQKVYT